MPALKVPVRDLLVAGHLSLPQFQVDMLLRAKNWLVLVTTVEPMVRIPGCRYVTASFETAFRYQIKQTLLGLRAYSFPRAGLS